MGVRSRPRLNGVTTGRDFAILVLRIQTSAPRRTDLAVTGTLSAPFGAKFEKGRKAFVFWHLIKIHCPQGRGQPVPP
jgi:hypothetical protein